MTSDTSDLPTAQTDEDRNLFKPSGRAMRLAPSTIDEPHVRWRELAAVVAAVVLLAQSKKPAILSGSQLVEAEATAEVVALAERLAWRRILNRVDGCGNERRRNRTNARSRHWP
jgi:thiamine pyrophosphate-dependent acetolactate synthase large subunit-like protein